MFSVNYISIRVYIYDKKSKLFFCCRQLAKNSITNKQYIQNILNNTYRICCKKKFVI